MSTKIEHLCDNPGCKKIGSIGYRVTKPTYDLTGYSIQVSTNPDILAGMPNHACSNICFGALIMSVNLKMLNGKEAQGNEVQVPGDDNSQREEVQTIRSEVNS